MELVNKILSSNFFSIFTDMIRITNNWKPSDGAKPKLDFNNFVKKRLLLLAKFQFKPIKNFNLSLCLRLQFLLQFHLSVCLDEKSLQIYSQYLCKENKKLIFCIAQNDKNFEVMLREIQAHNYMHLEFMLEIFYGLRNTVDSFTKLQQLLNNLGFAEYLNALVGQFEVRCIEGRILFDVKNAYFQKRENFLNLLELIMFYIYRNKNCFMLKMFSVSSTTPKSPLLRFLFMLPFQDTYEKSIAFIMKILEIVIGNMGELNEESEISRTAFTAVFCDVVEQYQLYNHSSFFAILEMLLINKEVDTLKMIVGQVHIWPHIVANTRFERSKVTCISLIRLSTYMLDSIDSQPADKDFSDLLRVWLQYLRRGRHNLIASCIREALRVVNTKYGEKARELLLDQGTAELNSFLKPESWE